MPRNGRGEAHGHPVALRQRAAGEGTRLRSFLIIEVQTAPQTTTTSDDRVSEPTEQLVCSPAPQPNQQPEQSLPNS